MRAYIKIIIVLIFLITPCKSLATEYLYILNDKCINELYEKANSTLPTREIDVIKDSRGIILRTYFSNLNDEYFKITEKTIQKLNYIKNFLAKIENSAIIEVHTTANNNDNINKTLRNWEVSTVIANNIEAIITKPYGEIDQNRINSVGYGEFLPAENTPYNGGKDANRIDIIILCNVSGE